MRQTGPWTLLIWDTHVCLYLICIAIVESASFLHSPGMYGVFGSLAAARRGTSAEEHNWVDEDILEF